MQILTIIPARKDSKRLPGKNVKLFNGLPLIEHTIKLANRLDEKFDVIVNSDNLVIRDIVNNYNNVSFLERPSALSLDESPAIDYVKHTLNSLKKQYKAVLILQPTSPFTLIEDILECVRIFEKFKPSTVVSVVKVNHMYHPDKFKVMSETGMLGNYLIEEKSTNYQSMAQIYVRNCSIYLSDINTIRKYNKIISDPCIGYEMPAERSIDINDQLDFDFAEFLLNKNA